MVKNTKRKGFNFFRSYYDVYNELETDKDKIAFIEALFDRQFLGKKPENLKGMAKFAYISQTNSIDNQVKGWEDKTKMKLSHTLATHGKGGAEGVDLPPSAQEKGKEEEKEEEQYVINFEKLLLFLNSKTKRNFQVINDSIKGKYKARLNEGYKPTDISTAISNAVKETYHKEGNFKYLTPEFFSRATTLDKYSSTVEAEGNGKITIGDKASVDKDLDTARKIKEGYDSVLPINPA